MTTEEILEMEPGRELDCLVAEKVMGWLRGVDCSGAARFYDKNSTVMRIPPDDDSATVSLNWFSPSRDIAAAMSVLCTARKPVDRDFLIGNDGPLYFCEIDGAPRVRGQTISHAICLAALLAIAVSEPDPASIVDGAESEKPEERAEACGSCGSAIFGTGESFGYFICECDKPIHTGRRLPAP